MKRRRSAGVILTLGAALTGCNRTAPDPCAQEHFDTTECQSAVRNQGYYSHGTFIRRSYGYDYPYYYGRYGSYAASGGRVTPAEAGAYSHSSSSSSSSSISRGGFGGTASGGAGE
jgi:hypothetical protein